VRPGDHLDFIAEIDVIGALSACPGGDCGAVHSSDEAACHPLMIEVFDCAATPGWQSPPRNRYEGGHGAG